jgi:ribose transport system ATP-binding protein
MDEPTSSLTISETRRLIGVIRDLKASGVTVVFISHRLREIEESADRVVVLRDGRVAGHLARAEIKHDAMIRLMIGRDLKALYTPPKAAAAGAVLELVDVTTTAHPATKVNLTVRSGEILGLSGLVGAGRTELARAVFGIDPLAGGQVNLAGRPITIGAAGDAIAQGIFLVPEDRKRSGLLLEMSVSENVSLADLGAFASGGLIDRGAEAKNAEQQKRQLNIRVPSVDVQAGALSGGNQQKVVLAKWLSMKPKAIIFDEPTRGIDVGSKAEIYQLMRGLADNGVAVLMISSDLEEVIGVSDRVAVMREGAISGFLERAELSEEAVMRLATDSHNQVH